MDQPLVQNVADKKQVDAAIPKERLLREREIREMRAVLSTKEGRRFMWRLLGRCKTYGSIMETNSKIYYNAGQQDIGHYLMGEVNQAGEDLYLLMIKENKEEGV